MENVLKAEKLKFVGVDGWGQATFKHVDTGKYYCFTYPLYSEGETDRIIDDLLDNCYQLYTKSGYDFNGEPDYPVEYEV